MNLKFIEGGKAGYKVVNASSHLCNLDGFFGFPKNRKKCLKIGKRGGKSPKKRGKFYDTLVGVYCVRLTKDALCGTT